MKYDTKEISQILDRVEGIVEKITGIVDSLKALSQLRDALVLIIGKLNDLQVDINAIKTKLGI